MISLKYEMRKLFSARKSLYFIALTIVLILVYILWCLFCKDFIDDETIETYIKQNIITTELRPLTSFDPVKEVNINPEHTLCRTPHSNEPVLFFVFVVIGPSYFERRDVIRATWGNVSLYDTNDFKLVFSLGMSKDDEVNKRIEKESRLYKDILQIKSFNDSYQIMTTKIMKVNTRVFCTRLKCISLIR